MNREDLIEELLKNGYTKDDLKGKRQKTLLEMLNPIEQEQEDEVSGFFETLEETEEFLEKQPEKDSPPDIGSKEWTDYVLGLMSPEEKPNNCPTVLGLRRVCTQLFGAISTETNVIQPPLKQDGFRTAVEVTVYISGSPERRQSSVAECTFYNTDEPFRDYPLATAESRAEGRALKKLACLSVSTHEEVALSDNTRKKASDTMINAIKGLAKNNNVDINVVAAKEFPDLESVDLMTQNQAMSIRQEIIETIKLNKEKEKENNAS